MFPSRVLVGVAALLGVAACSSRPPPRLAVELTARATAKAGVVSLVVSDRERARRLREIYLEVVSLSRELDRARVTARAQCSSDLERQNAASAKSDPIGSGVLGCSIAPPLTDRAALDRYTQLMLESRSLLTPREFAKLARVR
ncbi:MAG TPA: hypothetical protein VER11_33755 [Polyangiaceae bacterium]|nr:hypothetical protein [Polyangiaceae bacterium]